MLRYRTNAGEMEVIGRAAGTLWERPIIEEVVSGKLPDHTQDHLPLSDCCIGTLEWER